ncbi:MAG: TetR/AcrR family transcriptional regulator [Anaerolineae bacterium]|nr:TetR/AcrR family transcriptional regulator [Anaerolineae bacterium]
MTRTYHSRRRTESAVRTRQTIVEAAVRMHSQGITTLSAVAEEAGVSLPTVNKYFPTREDLFTACTGHVAANLGYPSQEALAAIADPGERVITVVREAYRLNETTFGTTWTGYVLEAESPTLSQAVASYEDSINSLADILLCDWSGDISDPETMRRFVRAMLSPLTYRALRLKNGLAFDDAVRHVALALAGMLDIELRMDLLE